MVVSTQSVMTGTVWWVSYLRDMGEENSLYPWRGALCQIFLFLISMWFLVSLVGSSRISLHCLRFFHSSFSACTFNLLIWHILLVVPVPGSESSVYSWICYCLSCPIVTRWLGGNGSNCWCNVGAIQPIGIFLLPPSCRSMDFCRFEIFWTLFVMVQATDLLPSPLLPPRSIPHHPSFASFFRQIVCCHRMFSVPLIH